MNEQIFVWDPELEEILPKKAILEEHSHRQWDELF
jgi:hypothetical protein